MPISCHFRDCEVLLVAMTYARSAIASTGPLPFGDESFLAVTDTGTDTEV